MNILFVGPSWSEDLGPFARAAIRRNSQPPLGVLYLATVAERRGHRVRLLDGGIEGMSVEDTAARILADGETDLVGITATSPVFGTARRLAESLRSGGLRAPILIGGEHTNIFRGDALEAAFDYAFFGEAEASFDRFLERLERGEDEPNDVPGLAYRAGGTVVETQVPTPVEDLDELPFPALHLLRRGAYVMTFARHRPRTFVPLLASRGCPFRCVYCSEPLTSPTVRFRTPESLIAEVTHWRRRLGVRHFFFMDSNLTLRRSLIEGFCEQVLRRNLDITYEGCAREFRDRPGTVLLIDERPAAQLDEAGRRIRSPACVHLGLLHALAWTSRSRCACSWRPPQTTRSAPPSALDSASQPGRGIQPLRPHPAIRLASATTHCAGPTRRATAATIVSL